MTSLCDNTSNNRPAEALPYHSDIRSCVLTVELAM